MRYGYCFYLNHFSEYKNYFKGTTANMTFEWFIHNVGYKWFSMLEFFENNPDGEVSDNTISKGRCSEVDLGPTIFHDSKGKESSLSTGMKALYVISTPLGALFDYIMYTLN